LGRIDFWIRFGIVKGITKRITKRISKRIASGITRRIRGEEEEEGGRGRRKGKIFY
jgi:hypothetical protein